MRLFKRRKKKTQKVSITGPQLLRSICNRDFDTYIVSYIASCLVYMEAYDRTNAHCRSCHTVTSCREGTVLLDSIAIMSREKLPEFLVHKQEKIRIAANKRSVELYG